MKNCILALTLLFLPLLGMSSAHHLSDDWQHHVINFEQNKNAAGFQTWMIAQAENGWIYAANNNGLLEFDGVNWTLYPVRNGALRSVKIIDGRIYVGGNSEFGFFEPNDIGLLTYYSLSAGTEKWNGQVWDILSNEVHIYFICEKYLFVYDRKSGAVKSLRTERVVQCSAHDGNRLYLGTPYGIFFLNDKKEIEVLAASEKLKGRITKMIPYEGKLLVATNSADLYLVDNKDAIRIKTDVDNFVTSDKIYSMAISGSKVALCFPNTGAFVFDMKDRSYNKVFTRKNGLKSDMALCAFFDKDQNLWLGFDKGVSFIDLMGPARPLFASESPIGSGYCSVIFNNELYLGTVHGLYKIDKHNKLHRLSTTGGQLWQLQNIDNTLFCPGDDGITVVAPTETYTIDVPVNLEVCPVSAVKNKLLVGTYGFRVLEKKNNRWRYSHNISDFFHYTLGFLEDDEGGNFWLINTGEPLRKITFDRELTKIEKIKEYPGPMSFGENVYVRRIEKNIVVCALDGIYRYSRLSDNFEHYTELEALLEGPKYYDFLFVDKLKNIWFISGNQLKELPFRNGEYAKEICNWGFNNELIRQHEDVFLIDSTSAIVAAENAFVKLDITKQNKLPLLKTYIRNFKTSKNNHTLSYGSSQKAIELPYSLNSINIHFAAAVFPPLSNIMYSYRLRGLDDTWSEPSPNSNREYTNLNEGKYVFEVKALHNGYTSDEGIARIEFKIHPPWFRSKIAYSIYLLVVMSLLFVAYKKTIGRQKKIIHLKEQELIDQSKHYEEESELKNREIYELQNKNLQTELNFKTQEIVGYVLHLTRKNEMLDNVKKSAIGISRAIDEGKEKTALKQKVIRLISQINTSMEDDSGFEVFKSNFDFIHQDFFKLLDQKFPQLSRSDKVLCAYLKMNLSSKEIAPLLSISIRGVEVNRYRLRKKMGLSRDINLTEYMQTLQ